VSTEETVGEVRKVERWWWNADPRRDRYELLVVRLVVYGDGTEERWALTPAGWAVYPEGTEIPAFLTLNGEACHAFAYLHPDRRVDPQTVLDTLTEALRRLLVAIAEPSERPEEMPE
jgi:hypothetical protein